MASEPRVVRIVNVFVFEDGSLDVTADDLRLPVSVRPRVRVTIPAGEGNIAEAVDAVHNALV